MTRRPETSIAAPVVTHFRSMGRAVYGEVETDHGRCDAVVRYQDDYTGADILLALEVKADLTFEVISQAARWRSAAHYVAIVTPPRRPSQSRDLFVEILTKLGLGWLTVDEHDHVKEVIKAPPLRLTGPAWLTDFLREEQQAFAPAGNATGARFTPFSMTRRQVVEYVRAHPRCALEEIFAAGVTHYRSELQARELAKLARRGELGPVRAKHDGVRFRFYCDEEAVAPARAEATAVT